MELVLNGYYFKELYRIKIYHQTVSFKTYDKNFCCHARRQYDAEEYVFLSIDDQFMRKFWLTPTSLVWRPPAMIMIYFCNDFSTTIGNFIATDDTMLEASAVLNNSVFFPSMTNSWESFGPRHPHWYEDHLHGQCFSFT